MDIFTNLEITQNLKISNDLEILQDININGNILMSGEESTLNLKTIKSNRSTTSDPFGNYVDISGSALLVPRGPYESRMSTAIDGSATAKAGMIMYDTSQNQFIGVIDTAKPNSDGPELVWTGLGGVISTDQKTRIETTNDDNNDGLKFYTDGNLNMCINKNGNVGIGNAMFSANEFLSNASHLNLFTNTDASFLISHAAIGELGEQDFGGGLKLTFDTDGNAKIYNTYSTGDLIFGSGGYNDRMRILANGNVGIGTVSSTAKLQVNGEISGTKLSLNDGLSNTIVGYQALYSNTIGYSNTANGYEALYSNTEGYSNTANGLKALYSNTEGHSNTANGGHALYKNTTGDFNTAIGYLALFNNTTGYNNTANGNQALYSNTEGHSNTANGYQALQSNTTGDYNTANGNQALYSNTTGHSNTANGYQALYFNTGSNNTANGRQALYENITGINNTAIGYRALFSNTIGNFNTANGYEALDSNTGGHNNTANGNQALYSNTTGYSNTANGLKALYANTTGHSNTANGYGALFNNTIGKYNTANGYQALYSNATGISNTANGLKALYNNTGGFENTATGNQALKSNTIGNYNTANGYKALWSNTTGDSNTAYGCDSLFSNTIGANNTAIGYQAGKANSNNKINTICIGADSSVTEDNMCCIGNPLLPMSVGIGTPSPEYKLHVDGTFFASISIETNGDITAFAASDKRLKNNIKPIQNPLEKLKKINGYTFDWIEKKDIHSNKGNDIGVIAQEIEEVLPEITTTRDNGYKAVRYEKLTPFLISCIKEQQKQIENQQTQIENQQTQIENQQSQIESLQYQIDELKALIKNK